MEWNVHKTFGDGPSVPVPDDDDEISALAYNAEGTCLAVGDFNGRVILFSDEKERIAAYANEFEAHKQSIDVLMNKRIQPTVTTLEWCPWGLLTSNERFMTLWSVRGGKIVSRRVYNAMHAEPTPIHSVSANSDGFTVVSSTSDSIDLWSLESKSSKPYSLLNASTRYLCKYSNPITRVVFHPTRCNELLWSTMSGKSLISDLRTSSKISSTYSQKYGEAFDTRRAPIMDTKYVGTEGTQFVTRDFLTLKLWDTRFESKHVHAWKMHESFPNVAALYKSGVLDDTFDCSTTSSGTYALTGTYAHTCGLYHLKKLDSVATMVHTKPQTTHKGMHDPLLRLACNPKFASIACASTFQLYFLRRKSVVT